VGGAELAALTDWAEALAKRSAEGLLAAAAAGGEGRQLLQTTPATVRVPIYIHAITNAAGRQRVTDFELTRQLNTLNAAYAPWGIQFELQGGAFNRVTSDLWTNVAPFDKNSNAMVAALRQGGGDALNVFVTEIKDVLGCVLVISF
jgi:hypothetical protein